MKPGLSIVATMLGVMCFSQLARADISPSASTDNDLPARIEIQSSWGFLSGAQRTAIVITRDGDHYRFTAAGTRTSYRSADPEKVAQSGAVDASKIRALVIALRAAPIPGPDIGNIGITREWLTQHIDDDKSWLLAGGAPNQLALFRSTFTDPTEIQKLLPKLFSSFHTDDYPFVGVSVIFAGGDHQSACASGQHALMLPWVLSGSCAHFDADAGPRVITYNADLSRAVAALMPPDATNQSRLNGTRMASELGDQVYFSIRESWDLLGVDNKAPGLLARLRARYSVKSAVINEYDQSLHVTLTSSTLPPNMTYALVLPNVNGSYPAVDEFLKRGHSYQLRVLSVPWLASFVREHANVPFRISYGQAASMDDEAMNTFSADMHEIGRDDLAAEVRAVRERATLLNAGRDFREAQWIVLPDHRLVLWHFDGPDGLLKWTPSDFTARSCADHAVGVDGGGCVGAVITASGELQK